MPDIDLNGDGIDDQRFLLLMHHRWCDSEIGRFIQQDPIGEEGGLNLYAYVGASPTMWVDPTGLMSSKEIRMRSAASSSTQFSGAGGGMGRGPTDVSSKGMAQVGSSAWATPSKALPYVGCIGMDGKPASWLGGKADSFLAQAIATAEKELGAGTKGSNETAKTSTKGAAERPTGIVLHDNADGELAALREGLEDPQKAAQLQIRGVKRKKSIFRLRGLLGFSQYDTDLVVTNGGADWSNSDNPNARLLQSAMDSNVTIIFDIDPDADLGRAKSGLTRDVIDRVPWEESGIIAITMNPTKLSSTTVPGPGGRISVPSLGIAIMHEFGHAWGNYHDKVGGWDGWMAGTVDTNPQAVTWENLARGWHNSLYPNDQYPLTWGHD